MRKAFILGLQKFLLKQSSRLQSVFLFITFLVLCQGCISGRNSSIREWEKYEWKKIKQDKHYAHLDWTSYSRKKRGSKFKEFKIVGLINVPPEKAIEALKDKIVFSDKYIEEKEGFVEILSNIKDEIVAYSVYNMPFLFRDREMCERFAFSDNKENGIHKIIWEEDWSVAPPKIKGAVRMPVARGSWEFVPIGTGKSMATYKVYAEPGGSIPAWMVNSTVGKGLPKELKNLEEIIPALE